MESNSKLTDKKSITIDLTGQKRGKMNVIRLATESDFVIYPTYGRKRPFWLIKCDNCNKFSCTSANSLKKARNNFTMCLGCREKNKKLNNVVGEVLIQMPIRITPEQNTHFLYLLKCERERKEPKI